MSSMDTDSDSDLSGRPTVDLFIGGELSDQDPDMTTTDPDQTYRETMQGIRPYMGWTYISNMDTAASTGDDDPFAGPKTQAAGKVSVHMPTDEWLC